MMWFGVRLFFLVLALTASVASGWLSRRRRPLLRRSVCYGEWGCFSLGRPFINTGHLPDAPDQLGVQFFLQTGPTSRTRLELDWSADRLREVVDVSKDTRVIVHGYRDNGSRHWVHNMVQALLERADQNVVVVDWEEGARSVNYFQVAANTRLVGRMLGGLLERLVAAGARASSFHVIGASLGAHISGYAGAHLSGIGRITGLDPAGPSFENTEPEVRLDPSDAIFVDVIHTNAVPFRKMGLGIVKPCGTVDFYPNGGRYMPGCRNSILDQLFGLLEGEDYRLAMGCSHLRAVDYFTESIKAYQCSVTAVPCSFPAVTRRRACSSSYQSSACGGPRHHCGNCVTMGYDVSLNASGVFYTRTQADSPFCQAGC